MVFPKVYLAIDNVFASKRWTEPDEWMQIIKDAGICYIETSADNECDPLYTTIEYLSDWINNVKHFCEKKQITISNFFSGHGTYATTGLSHSDERVRRHILENWIKPFIHMAGKLDAGVGFYCHAFPISVLQSFDQYSGEIKKLEDLIREIADYASAVNNKPISVEQMYSPHQYPWTIESTLEFIRNTGVYITLDTGHQVGQKKHLKPSVDIIEKACNSLDEDIWTGTSHSYNILKRAQQGEIQKKHAICLIEEDIENNPHLFAREEDCDLYRWAEEIGCYSPIIHLQQTNGDASKHWSFTENKNSKGIVNPGRLLKAIKKSYQQPVKPGMPSRCKEITFTLELFYSKDEYPFRILSKVKESVDYWRKFIPKDGMYLNELPYLNK